MSTDTNQELITKLIVMKAFPDPFRKRIAPVFEEVSETKTLQEGSYLFHLGDKSVNDGFIVLSGTIRIMKRVIPPYKAEAPALLGEMRQSKMESERSADVYALEEIEFLHFDWDRFHNLLKERLARSEYAIFSRALSDYSWLHLQPDEV